mmetsp:Transcript_31254/g.61889  ORF Transcript_31254/g.61889 Transcript_31254/m.61889 type:complete len:349 (-) Transcript_31254:218-1264(-)
MMQLPRCNNNPSDSRNYDDNEKDSKVRRQTNKRLGRVLMTVGGLVAMGLLISAGQGFSTKNRLRQQQALVLEEEKHHQMELKLKLEVEAEERERHKVALEEKTAVFDKIVREVRTIKGTGVIMETDPKSLEVTGRLKVAARELCKTKYGDYIDQKPYRLAVTIQYQNDQFSQEEQGGHFVIEMAPLSLQPYSVYNFMEVARGHHTDASGSGFHRKAGHVLQATMSSDFAKKPLAFQEYSKDYPHKKRTVGYCGRPSGGGGCWYISTMDNTQNHGPGSQQQKNPHEADANFGKVISGYEVVVPKIRQSMPKEGFLSDRSDWVLITDMTILVPANNDPNDEDNLYVEWKA